MNEIEQRFYDAWNAYYSEPDDAKIEPHKVIGPYCVDFYIYSCFCGFVIELDGHEAHKTKEQRDHDYKRERFLQKKNITVIRFTGTEVFLDATKCVQDAGEIMAEQEVDVVELLSCQEMCFKNGLIKKKWVLRGDPAE